MQLTAASSGSQLLYNSFLFHSKIKNEFILETCKVGHLKKNVCLMESEMIFLSRFFLPNLCSKQGCKWKIIGEMLESQKIEV